MRRLSPLTVFVLSAFGWIVVLTLLWSQVSAWTSHPVGVLSHIALEQGTPMWVRQVHLKPGSMEVDTAIAVPVPEAGGRRAEISIDADPARYAYGLPIFLGLLLAARSKGLAARAAMGYVLLLPAQAFSLTLYVLMQMVLAAQLNIRFLRVSQWQMELIIYGYQMGSLVVPTLTPILLWLWMDRKFVADVLVRGSGVHKASATVP
ncbi:hypothetical protein ALDI51_05740 [Alicycliphilus denitrificans]|uniref:exosortase H-associated membrane protein n=1 Tax=Alicycliphilus denitrificans TaxID=179636 RepID=UPI000964E43A|nr:exosortase H-associated membrane protein [Alicycliphilus denitrificans]MBN9572668.1 hypothetical protein [Alicycliphilus denitrificans]OJW92627.1 MAG: hypothetical protein BGO66_21220 [Alicycliphilus sp. 69-12]BCN37255.1 hypothetical protein ALDI51_05740 [Alicycliphilus denitrificans]